MASKVTEVNCPYCGKENRVRISIQNGGFVHPEMRTCDPIEGGCDIPFIVTARVNVDARGTRIDWSKDDYPHVNQIRAKPEQLKAAVDVQSVFDWAQYTHAMMGGELAGEISDREAKVALAIVRIKQEIDGLD